jgi:hypothetical protein
MTYKSMITRLAQVEARIGVVDSAPIKVFFCQGPVAMDGHEYLRGLGYDLPEASIVVHFIGAEDGKPVDVPVMDLNPTMAPQHALPAFGG